MAERYIIIIGCGRLGALLASSLSGLGDRVVIVDCHAPAFDRLAPEFGGFKVHGDAIELDILRQANIDQASHLLAVTNNDNVNLMVAQVAKTIFAVPHVITRVTNTVYAAVFSASNITMLSPTRLAAVAFLQAIDVDLKDILL